MKRLLWFLPALALAACTSAGPPGPTVSPFSLGTGTPSIPGTPTPLPVQVHDPGQVTGQMASPCHTRSLGTLPDRACTPGAYDPTVTAAMLCSPTYRTSSYRPPESQTTHYKYSVIEPAYGMNHVSGELDHLISLELGGANDVKNLWVEAGKIPNAKDSVENALHDWVCAVSGNEAQVRLTLAQVSIAMNWKLAEKRLGIG